MAESATTINENGFRWQYAVPSRVVQRSSTLLVLESPRMSLTRDALSPADHEHSLEYCVQLGTRLRLR